MTHFIKRGDKYFLASESELDVRPNLPAENFIINVCPETQQLSLEKISKFELPKQLYGNTKKTANRIIRTYRERGTNTGVLLVGEKGSGKSLLAKVICDQAKIPVIVINANISGDSFCKFLQSIEQECIIFFDEFEKTYSISDRDGDKVSTQESILTLLDGVYSSKKLFLFTSNSKFRIDENMRNRPGRIYYFLEFFGIEENVLKQYCEKNLNNKSHFPNIFKISQIFTKLNFDMPKALVEEVNRYDEDPFSALKFLNIKQEFEGSSKYVCTLKKKNKIVAESELVSTVVKINPLIDEYVRVELKGDVLYFYRKDMVRIIPESGEYTYISGDYKLILRKDNKSEFSLLEQLDNLAA